MTVKHFLLKKCIANSIESKNIDVKLWRVKEWLELNSFSNLITPKGDSGKMT